MRRTSVGACVVIGHENHVGCSVILKWGAEADKRPGVGAQGHFPTEHLIGSFYGNPVGLTGEGGLVGGFQIEVVGSGLFRTSIEEGDARDGSGRAYLFCGIDLLGKRLRT